MAIYTYPVKASLAARHPPNPGTYTFTLLGPPGSYQAQVTSDFSTWTNQDLLTNTLGSAAFSDLTAGQRIKSFYRVKVEP